MNPRIFYENNPKISTLSSLKGFFNIFFVLIFYHQSEHKSIRYFKRDLMG